MHKSPKKGVFSSGFFDSVAALCAKDATGNSSAFSAVGKPGQTAPLSDFLKKKLLQGFSSTKSTLY
jgi:hypothetical protein